MSDVDKIISELVPRYKKGPAKDHTLIYDSSSETLEPIYFWILDLLEKRSEKVIKLVDNFASSPGGGHFGDMMQRASQMQQEASRVLGTINNILKGIINLIYDLKEFKIRLSHYEQAKSPDKEKSQAAILALKQIWMDKVDIQRGQGSINALSSGNLQFVTLRDAFMMVNSVKEVDELDLNDRVKRVLKPRVQEFFEWKIRSEQELKKRFEIEKLYLKSQVEALKLNARWAKPYLKAAQMMMQQESMFKSPEMVTAFNTILLELSLMSQTSVDLKFLCEQEPPLLPREFIKMKNLKKFYSVVIVDFNFRGIPSKFGQNYVFGGKAEVFFRAYGLSEEELIILKKRLDENDFQDSLRLIQGMTDDSLLQIQADLDEIFSDEKKSKTSSEEDVNPFLALFSFFQIKKKEKEKNKEKEDKIWNEYKKTKKLRKDNYAETYIRNYAEAEAMNFCFQIYDSYKKAHGMVSFPYGGDENIASPPRSIAEDLFGFK
ncbi:MAG: hypothetical protein QXW97_01090 [Candidatus Pacearchaeota archaeon]